MAEVTEVHPLHGSREAFIFDHDVQLVVTDPARDIQIAGAYPRPAAIGDCALGMHHGPVPLVDPDPRFEQRAVSEPRERPEPGEIACPGHEEPDIHAVEGRRAERLDV
jgi:hypothetical protein